MSTAKFRIRNLTTGGAWSPFSARAFDASPGNVLELQLEDQPALDIISCSYAATRSSKSAPAPTFQNSGVANPPSSAITLTVPAAVPGMTAHSWLVRCQTNGGAAVLVNGKPDYTSNNAERIVAVRSPLLSQRKIIAVESTQYSESGGWADAQNDQVDQLENNVGAGQNYASGIVFPVGGTFSITQTAKATNVAPTNALIKAQGANTGDARDGASLTLSGGDPGDTDHNTGNIIVELGPPDDVNAETASFVVHGNSTDLLAVFMNGAGEVILKSGEPVGVDSPIAGFFGSVSLILDRVANAITHVAGRHLFGGQLVHVPSTSSPGAALTPNMDVSDELSITLTANLTIGAPTNVAAGATYTFKFTQDALGPWTVTWNAVFRFGAVSSAVTAAINAIDYFVFKGDSGGVLRLLHASKGVHV